MSKILDQIAISTVTMLHSIKAIEFSNGQPFVYTSGIKSPIYTDCRLLISHPREWKKVIDNFIEMIKIKKLKFDVIASTGAGIPHASLIAARLKKPMIYVRPKAKDHGKKKIVEGSLKKGQEVLFVEDHITTGNSAVFAIEEIRKIGGKVKNCISIFTYNKQEAKENEREHKIKFIPLTDPIIALPALERAGQISKSKMKETLSWLNDYGEWTKEKGFAY